jgi:hypothetical protein
VKRKPKPIEVSKFAHDAALHFLARPKAYGLTDAVGRDLTEVVEGYTGRCDEAAEAWSGCAPNTEREARLRGSSKTETD